MKKLFLIISILFSFKISYSQIEVLERSVIKKYDSSINIETTNEKYIDTILKITRKDKKLLFYKIFDNDKNRPIMYSFGFKKEDVDYVYELFDFFFGIKPIKSN